MINFENFQFTHTCPFPIITVQSSIHLASRKSSSIFDNSTTHLYARFGIVSHPSVIAIVHASRYGFIALRYRPSCPPSFSPPQENARQHFRQPAAMTNAASSGGPAIIRLRLHRGSASNAPLLLCAPYHAPQALMSVKHVQGGITNRASFDIS